jgi:DNA-directed RNA polymerase subunit beta'
LRGLCAECYGYDLAYNKKVKLGTAVGIIAAQSIGEPGTQLTMRTFHMGGAGGADITQGLPRVEELFEARSPKHRIIAAEAAGKVKIIEAEKRVLQTATGEKLVDTQVGNKTVMIAHSAILEDTHSFLKRDTVKVKDGDKVKEGQALIVRANGEEVTAKSKGTVKVEGKLLTLVYEGDAMAEHEIPVGYHLVVKDGQEVEAGDPLTDGQYDLQDLFRLKGYEALMRYILKEVLAVYASQSIKLNAKHIEVIVRQMLSRVYIRDAGDTDLLPGQVIEKSFAQVENDRVGEKKGQAAEFEQLFMGITKVALSTESFLSAASFMETARVLINAAVTGKIDRLEGLKENVIIGRLTPAGTGFGANAEVALKDEKTES